MCYLPFRYNLFIYLLAISEWFFSLYEWTYACFSIKKLLLNYVKSKLFEKKIVFNVCVLKLLNTIHNLWWKYQYGGNAWFLKN